VNVDVIEAETAETATVEIILMEIRNVRQEIQETKQELRETKRLLEDYRNPNRWISVKEAAEIAGLSGRQIYRCIESGDVYSKKFGGSRKIALASVVAYATERKTKEAIA